MLRRIRKAWLHHCLTCLVSERAQYVANGAASSGYITNCEYQEFDLRSRIALLETNLHGSIR